MPACSLCWLASSLLLALLLLAPAPPAPAPLRHLRAAAAPSIAELAIALAGEGALTSQHVSQLLAWEEGGHP